MHLLATSTTALDDLIEPIDLNQRPGDIAILSFADSDLAGLAAAWAVERDALPSVRLAHLRDLRHPMSVDLWIEKVGAHAKVILVRLLGGLDWWRYGIDQLSALARENGTVLAVLPGEDRDDPRLAAASTLAPTELDTLLAFFREGGRENLRALLRHLAGYAGKTLDCRPPQPVPRMAGYLPGEGAVSLERLIEALPPNKPVVPIVFYRALVLAADTAPIDALLRALAERGLAPAPLFVTRLKDEDAARFIADALNAARSRRDHLHHRVRGRRQSGRADAARWAGRAGAAGDHRVDQARRLGGKHARAWRRRPRHERGAARARRPRARGRDIVQATLAGRMRRLWLSRGWSTSRSPTASLWWRIARPPWHDLEQRRAPRGASPS